MMPTIEMLVKWGFCEKQPSANGDHSPSLANTYPGCSMGNLHTPPSSFWLNRREGVVCSCVCFMYLKISTVSRLTFATPSSNDLKI